MTDPQAQAPAIHALDFTRINPFNGEPLPENQRAYRAKSGRVLIKPSIELLRELDDEGLGFCLACGNHDQFAEPDMERGKCECCGEAKVYGAGELALRGLCF
jgi:hypothetical protein